LVFIEKACLFFYLHERTHLPLLPAMTVSCRLGIVFKKGADEYEISWAMITGQV